MNTLQANRMVKLAQFLEELPKEKFDYGRVHEVMFELDKKSKSMKVDCHTSACALGWCPSVFPNSFKADISDINVSLNESVDLDVLLKNKNNNEWELADEENTSEFFGITEDEFGCIFYGRGLSYTYGVGQFDHVTKEMVAKKLYETVRKYGFDIV